MKQGVRLVDLLKIWLDESPSLSHFRVSNSKLMCDCIDHAYAEFPTFCIYADGVVEYSPGWPVRDGTLMLMASHPDFLSKLHDRMVRVCQFATSAYPT